jgi:cyclopropane fatty-acyl-phospholipid synthase-like methyltransferase
VDQVHKGASEKMKDSGTQFHFNPQTYLHNIRAAVPEYDEMQDMIATIATSNEIQRFLDLGAGTGETAMRILKHCPAAEAVLIDVQDSMVSVLQKRFGNFRTSIHKLDFGLEIPRGPYCAVVSLFAVHHLKGELKKNLFHRIFDQLKSGGYWAFGDVYKTTAICERKTAIDRVHDFPSTEEEVEAWLSEAGFTVRKPWRRNDLVVYACCRK